MCVNVKNVLLIFFGWLLHLQSFYNSLVGEIVYAVFGAHTHYFWDQVSGVNKTFEANVLPVLGQNKL